MMPLGVTFVQETTVFREFGPLAGNTMRLGLRSRAEDRQHAVAADRRRRRALLPAARRHGLLALRARGFKSWGDSPGLHVLRRQLRDARLRLPEFVGQNAFFLNAELRFPFIEAMAHADRRPRRHPRRVLRQHRRRPFDGQPFKWSTTATRRSRQPIIGYDTDRSARQRPDLRAAAASSTASGWWTRARPTASASRPSRSASRSTSTGRGDAVQQGLGRRHLRAQDGGSAAFRKPKFAVWIGYDF